MPTVDSTAGGPVANSFLSLAEAATYFDERLALDPAWITTGDAPARLLIMATRVLSAMMVPHKSLRWDKEGKAYYYVSRAWTGVPSTVTQSLPWPMTGMYDRLGRAIPSNVVPKELKEATAELAGQLGIADRTLDNDIKVQGITSVRAGSVALTFKEIIDSQVLPDAVLALLVPSWLSDELIDYATQEFVFEAV